MDDALYLILKYCCLIFYKGTHMNIVVEQMGFDDNYCWKIFLHEQSMSSIQFDTTYVDKFNKFPRKMYHIWLGISRVNGIIINPSTQ